MMLIAIPLEVAEQFDLDLSAFVGDPRLDEDEAGSSEGQANAERRPFYVGGIIPRDERPSDDSGEISSSMLSDGFTANRVSTIRNGINNRNENVSIQRRARGTGLAVEHLIRRTRRSNADTHLSIRNSGEPTDELQPFAFARFRTGIYDAGVALASQGNV